MAITITDFDEIGYTHSSAQEVVCRLRNGNWYGEYSSYYGHFDGLSEYVRYADRLCGNVFILSSRGESETVRLRQALPDANFIYPQLHRPAVGRYEFESGYKPNRYEINVRRKAPFAMCIAHTSAEFRKVMAPYLIDGRRFIMNDDIFMLLSMRF